MVPKKPSANNVPAGMTSGDFKKWRKSLGISQKQAAEYLGLKRRGVQYYEKGERDGEKVAIPKYVRLACWALSQGVSDYHGPDRQVEDQSLKVKKKKQDAPSSDSVSAESAPSESASGNKVAIPADEVVLGEENFYEFKA